MNEKDKKITINQHSELPLPKILYCAARAKQYDFEEMADLMMVSAFNRIMRPQDKLEGLTDDDVKYAKAMLKITAFSILELLDDFNASEVISELEDNEKHR